MRFQVLSSTIRYSNPLISRRRGITLSFGVFPSELGELKFSDGSRLIGCDLSENFGEPLTLGILSEKLRHLGYDDLGKEVFWPLNTTVTVTDEDWKGIDFLKNEEFACGYAEYRNSEHAHELLLWVSVESEDFRDLLQARLDLGGQMALDLRIRGLEGFEETWDLSDTSDCGDGYCRVITRFSLERTTRHFDHDIQTERAEAARVEDRKDIEKIRSLLADIVAVEKGSVDGAVAKLLRLNLIAASAIVVIGILSLARLYF